MAVDTADAVTSAQTPLRYLNRNIFVENNDNIADNRCDRRRPDIVSIVVGDWQRSAASTVRQTLDVDVIKMHPDYNSRTYENDISLVKVTTDIVFSEDVAPVCAPDPANDYVYYKSQCAGWGSLSSGMYSLS